MKKSKKKTQFCLAILFFCVCTAVHAGDSFRVYYSGPSLSFNQSKYAKLTITNEHLQTMDGINIRVAQAEGLEIELINGANLSLPPDEKVTVDIKITSKTKTLFKKFVPVLIEIRSGDILQLQELTVSVVPDIYVWPIVGLFIVSVLIVILIIVFRKLVKGEQR